GQGVRHELALTRYRPIGYKSPKEDAMTDVCATKPPARGRALVPILGLLFLLGSCSQPEIKPPVPITPSEDRSTAAVARVPAPEPISPYQPELLIRPLSVVVPVGAIYICVNESA